MPRVFILLFLINRLVGETAIAGSERWKYWTKPASTCPQISRSSTRGLQTDQFASLCENCKVEALHVCVSSSAFVEFSVINAFVIVKTACKTARN